MKCVILLVFLAVVAASVSGATTTKKPCIKKCGDYKPVCANVEGKPVTFGSQCVMENYKCENGKEVIKNKEGECGGNAPVRLS